MNICGFYNIQHHIYDLKLNYHFCNIYVFSIYIDMIMIFTIFFKIIILY